jgi:D-glycero-alpha-D-manno-heptose-7-phosphate kinase
VGDGAVRAGRSDTTFGQDGGVGDGVVRGAGDGRTASALVRAHAPVRVCDVGGWTDTWFAGHGAVCGLAVGPGVTVTARTSGPPGTVVLDLPDVGDRVAFRTAAPPGRHPLVEQAVVHHPATALAAGLELAVAAAVPPGSSVGTSAALCVAVLGALDALAGGPPSRDAAARLDVARRAHAVEVERLGLQSGVQDQLLAAHGGATWIAVERYPQATVTPVALGAGVGEALDRRLVTAYLGRPHASSAVHEQVIAALGAEGPDAPRLARLRDLAAQARAALVAGDLAGWGAVLDAATAAQAALHPSLVGAGARAVLDVARGHGAAGAKVNGAGGDGGSVTVLAGDDPAPLRAALAAIPGVRLLDLRLDRVGLTVDPG